MVSWSKSHLTCINKVIFWKKHWEPLKGKKAAAIDIMTQASSKIKKKKKSHICKMCSSIFPQGTISRGLK